MSSETLISSKFRPPELKIFVCVTSIDPAGNTDVLSRIESVDTDMNYNVVALGSVAAGTLDMAIVPASNPAVAVDGTGGTPVQFILADDFVK